MRAICPVSPEHKMFETTAHVQELWRVNERGEFLEVLHALCVTAAPDHDNTWICCECGAEALHIKEG